MWDWPSCCAQDAGSLETVLKVAAAREVFEESGIKCLTPLPSLSAAETAKWREEVHDDGDRFQAFCESQSCRLAAGCVGMHRTE